MAQDIYQGRKGSITGEILNFRDSGAVRSDSATSLTESEQAQARANIGAGGSNRNLLDNPFFSVNQRGFSTASTANTIAYTVDRWYIGWQENATLNPDGTITVVPNTGNAPYFAQRLSNPELYAGKTLTLSVIADGTLYYATGVAPSSQGATTSLYAHGTGTYFGRLEWAASGILNVVLASIIDSKPVKAVKLELGSFSTLANDAPPNYAAELYCGQWFFERILGKANNNSIGYMTASSTTLAFLPIQLKPKRTALPTITTSGVLYFGKGTLSLGNITAVNWLAFDNNSGYGTLQLTGSGFTVDEIYRVGVPNNGYIDFSSDL